MSEQLKQAQSPVKEATRLQASSSFGVIFAFTGVVVLGIALLFAWNKGYLTSAPTASSAAALNIVYMDMGSIVSVATKKYLDNANKDGKSNPSAMGKEFSDRLSIVLNEYKAGGVIVLDGRYVLASPDGRDVTKEVAKKLNLELDN